MDWVVIRTNAKSPEMTFQGEELSRWGDYHIARNAAMTHNVSRRSPKIYAMVVPATRWDIRDDLIKEVRRIRESGREAGANLFDIEEEVDDTRYRWATTETEEIML